MTELLKEADSVQHEMQHARASEMEGKFQYLKKLEGRAYQKIRSLPYHTQQEVRQRLQTLMGMARRRQQEHQYELR